MFHSIPFRSLGFKPLQTQLAALQSRNYAATSRTGDDAAELDEARKWFANFDQNTIPKSISKTEYARSSGPGGQKVNK